MRKVILLSVVAVLYTAAIEAQVRASDAYTISGQVVDSLSNEPVAFATIGISLPQAATQYINAVATDDNGKFEIQLKSPGNYVMIVQSVEITTLTKTFEVTESNRSINFDKILVHENVQSLSEVTVTAIKPLVKIEIDKLTYNMEEDPDAKVNNTLEMLRKVPLLTVDGDDKIQLKGSSNFVIYLNGKPSNLLKGQNVSDVLKSMPANTIKNIEVITDPGARYDAEGISGIINIITTRNVFQGYQGSVAANTSTFGAYGGNMYLTAKTGKFGLTGNFSYNNNRRPESKVTGESENFINDMYRYEFSESKSRNSGTYTFGRLEASYEFDSLRLLSLGVDHYNSKSKNISDRMIEMQNIDRIPEYSYKTDGETKYNWGSTGINLDYQRSTRKKDEFLTISYRFNDSPDGSEVHSTAKDIMGNIPLYTRLNQWFDNKARTTEHSGQIDYVNPINPKHSIETGLKYIFRQNISKVKQYEPANGNWAEIPPNINNNFEHNSHIYAGYVGYAFKADKFGLRTGLRAEGTKQDVKFRLDESRNFDIDYYNLVPSATLSYQLKPTQQLRIGYNLRISRPSIWYLNPYVNDTDPYNISYGNPNLEPQKSHNINLNYSYFSTKYTLNISPSYFYTNNAISNYSFIDPADPDVRRTTYGNTGSNQNASIYVTGGWTPNPTLRVNLNGGLYYREMKSAELDISNSGFGGNCYMNVQLTLPKDFRINAMGQYQGKYIMLQGSQSALYIASIGINKDFLQKKMTVSLSYISPYSKYLKFDMSTKTEHFENNMKQAMPYRQGSISISYRFGSMKEGIRKAQRGITNDDVMGGGGGGSSTNN